MKNHALFFGMMLLLCCSCKKEIDHQQVKEQHTENFTKYTIHKGNQYCDLSALSEVDYRQLKFIARFDSTAIYHTKDPANQYDINKLYGFSDNNGPHHDFSARLGWRWSNDSLRLFGYVYNNGERIEQEISIINLYAAINCSITVKPGRYEFEVDGRTLNLPRASTGLSATGYKLFPYFGGDEPAPHDIHIWIKELP